MMSRRAVSRLCNLLHPPMVRREILHHSRLRLPAGSHFRYSSDQKGPTNGGTVDVPTNKIMTTHEKYKLFKDEEAPLILDVEEERMQASNASPTAEIVNEFRGISLDRGVRGVFDVEELVSILKSSSVADIVVITVPKDCSYVEHMVIVTGKSQRHMLATADFIRRAFKKKRCSTDRIPKVEGKQGSPWIALDLGNIALHIFSESARETYDLECLWAVGSEFDTQVNRPHDPLTAIIHKHSVYLGDLHPADVNG